MLRKSQGRHPKNPQIFASDTKAPRSHSSSLDQRVRPETLLNNYINVSVSPNFARFPTSVTGPCQSSDFARDPILPPRGWTGASCLPEALEQRHAAPAADTSGLSSDSCSRSFRPGRVRPVMALAHRFERSEV
jgi:hypothetical protein